LEDLYASQFCKEFAAPAIAFRKALRALIIKFRLVLLHKELVVHIKKKLSLVFHRAEGLSIFGNITSVDDGVFLESDTQIDSE